jgi:hypothetical protein
MEHQTEGQKALNKLLWAVELAQSRGAYNIKESAEIFPAMEFIVNPPTQEAPPEASSESVAPIEPLKKVEDEIAL